jgi:hypothetical protein
MTHSIRRNQELQMTLRTSQFVRAAVFVVLALAAVLAFFLFQPKEPKDRAAEISAALVTDAANAKSSNSAPQQQVVNGWTARDLLEIEATIANEQAQSAGGHTKQIAALLLIGVLAICWNGLSSDSGWADRKKSSPTDSAKETAPSVQTRLPKSPETTV